MSVDIITSAVAFIVTMLAAVMSQWVAIRSKKQSELTKLQAERIAEALKSEAAARKAATLEAVAQGFPLTENFNKNVEELLEKLISRLPPIQSGSTGAASLAVESLVTGYHEQALDQARAQFWFSVMAATVGFAWILYAGLGINSDSPSSLMKTLPGIVMDGVAFLFFKQASETRQRATELYDRLRKDKQTTEAAALVLSIADDKVRSVVQAQIALHMAGLQQSAIDFSSVLPKNA